MWYRRYIEEEVGRGKVEGKSSYMKYRYGVKVEKKQIIMQKVGGFMKEDCKVKIPFWFLFSRQV